MSFITGFINGAPQNEPPYIPCNASPANGTTNVAVNTQLHWNGGDPDIDNTVTYTVYFGTTNPPPKVVDNQTVTTYHPVDNLLLNTTYLWKIVAWDNHRAYTPGPIWHFTTRQNNPPNIPCQPAGPNISYLQKKTMFRAQTTDPDGDNIYYKWDFGDGTITNWDGPYTSGVGVWMPHIYTHVGIYNVRVKAKDIYGLESNNWSTPLVITIRTSEYVVDPRTIPQIQ